MKYEEVYLKGYNSLAEARRELGIYFEFYNRAPDVVYWASRQRDQVAA